MGIYIGKIYEQSADTEPLVEVSTNLLEDCASLSAAVTAVKALATSSGRTIIAAWRDPASNATPYTGTVCCLVAPIP